jgi:hypothetical protein
MYCSLKICHKEVAQVADNELGFCKDHLEEYRAKAEQLLKALKTCDKCGKSFDKNFNYCPFDATQLHLPEELEEFEKSQKGSL